MLLLRSSGETLSASALRGLTTLATQFEGMAVFPRLPPVISCEAK